MRICARCEKVEIPPQKQLCDTCRELALAESKKKYAEKNREPATGLYVSSVGAVVEIDWTLRYMGRVCAGPPRDTCKSCPARDCVQRPLGQEHDPEFDYHKAVSC